MHKNLMAQDIEEFIELIRVFEDVCEMKNFSIPEKAHLQNILSKPNLIVLVAGIENQIVGGYFPGLYTALIYTVLGPILMKRVLDESRINLNEIT